MSFIDAIDLPPTLMEGIGTAIVTLMCFLRELN